MIVRTIDVEATSINIRQTLQNQKIKVKDVQKALMVNEQAVLKWCNPKWMTLPSRDHIVKLAYLCKCRVEDFLVYEDRIFDDNSVYIRTLDSNKNDRDEINVWGIERDILSTEQVITSLQKQRTMINYVETSEQLKLMINKTEINIKSIQKIMGLGCVQTIYRWMDKADARLPTLDHLAMLAGICDCVIDDLLVYQVSIT